MAHQSNQSLNGEYYYFNYRKTLHDPIQAKTCYFYKDNDYKTPAAKVAIHPKRYRKFDNLLSELTRLVPALPFGVRSVYTPRGRSHIHNTDSLMHEGRYICSTHSHFARGVDVTRVQPPETWHVAKPPSGQRALNHLLQEEADDFSRAKRRRLARSGGHVYSGRRPKKIQLIRNGEPDFKHSMLLNRKTAQTFDQVMADMSEMFGFAIRKLYTVDGRRINNLNQLFHGPDLLFVAGSESFKAMAGFMYTPMPPSARGGSLRSVREVPGSQHQTRRNRMTRTRGKWRVSITTGDERSAGTTANVSLTIYGQKGSFGPHELGNNEDGQYFECGSKDEFEISAPGIGEIYKIRIGHDDTGPDPSWFCEQVHLYDLDTREELVFPCRKWMDSENGDRETCRELPVKRKGEPTLPVVVYEAKVVTGDLWNAGTDANIYMTIYGDRGDTGTRKLIPPKQNSFQQGKTDTFHIEAVSLGRLKRIIVGHDGTEPGNGWYLERIIVNDPMKNEDFNFYCGRWLDEGEDDMKIVREIHVQEEYMGDILEKRNWDMEKWKFDSKNQIKLISELTGKCLRIKGDGTVDANGDIKEEWVVFSVNARKSMVRSFSSVLNKGYNLAIDNGKTVGNGKGGAYCDFRVHVQHDSTVLLESVKYPLQFLTLLDNGRPADPRGEVDNESARIFYVYCKGMFRNRGVIMLKTSKTQTLAQDSEEGIYGTGKINRTAHFKIHKIGEKGVRMFESLINPGRFIRFYNDTFDCQGGKDESSHFIITKYPEKGYVTIESAAERGVFMGLTPTGEVVPSEDTGEKNVCFYPEVIEFGIPKRRNLDYDDDIDDSQTMSHRTPRTPKTPKTPKSARIEDGMWKIIVSTTETMKNGEVSLVAYGDKGNTGPITLAAPVKSGHIFQSGSVDEFTANLSKAGKLFKIRLELEAKSRNNDALWKVRQLKMEDLKTREIISLTFNRWLSPLHDDGSTARELPVKQENEDPLPVLTYIVMVYTGKEKGAATDANVYINLFGENGDCGKRWLNQSNKSKKFQAGQVDMFEVEAVHLGRVSKCLVGHDGIGPGDGWFLDHIVVKESENSKTEFVFPCKRWLDSSKDDRRIERMLPVSEEPEKQKEEVKPQSKAAVKSREQVKEKYKDGDWKVYVTTGNQTEMSLNEKIELYVYGKGDYIGPLVLGKARRGGLFQKGQTDEIKVNLGTKLKDLHKIRIGFDGRSKEEWFLEEVKLVNIKTNEEYVFKINRWLSRKQDDGDTWREAAVAKKGERTPENAVYQIEVTTGNLPKADTNADIYLNIIGKQADTGKRYLHDLKNRNKPFQIGKTDMFTIEGVPVGDFEKIIVGHDLKTVGAGWFLENIIITDINREESHFICNKWLDSGKGDKKIERIIYPDSLRTKTPIPSNTAKKDKVVPVKSKPVQRTPEVKKSSKPPLSTDHFYQLWVKTMKDSKPANGGTAYVTLYGSEGKSDVIELLPEPKSNEKLFEAGNVDEFEVNAGDIGDIYKLQVSRDSSITWQGWHLGEIRLLDKKTDEEHVFDYNCWLLRNDEGNSLVQELPIRKSNKPLYPVHTYRLSIYTGDRWAGETDANVFLTIYGHLGDSGKRGFYQPVKKPLRFRKGQVETFEIESVYLDKLERIVISHDGRGHGSGWFLDKVIVAETTGDRSHMQFIFPCGRWLDEGEEDGMIERELRLLDEKNTKERASTRSKSKSQGKWKVNVKTSDIENAGTYATVYLTLFGNQGSTETIPLGTGGVKSHDFQRGEETDFMISVNEVGDVTKIRLEHNNEGPDPSWHLDWVKLTNQDTGEELVFYGDCWLADDKGDKQICRELTLKKLGQTPLAVIQYFICIRTGEDREAEATEAIVSINIIGEKGETGIRPLIHSISGNDILWQSGDKDYFAIEAAEVGKIEKIRVIFDGDEKEKNWYLESVSIRSGKSAILESWFKCQQWFEVKNKTEDVAIEFYPKEVKIAEKLPDNVLNSLPCKKDKPSKGKWTITSYIGEAGTNDPVYLTVFGTSSHSEAIQINKSGAFKPYTAITTKTSLKNIGNIYKITIAFSQTTKKSSFFLNRIKLKDDDSKEELNFEVNDWIKTSDDNIDGTISVPAIYPDVPPYPETTYLVKVTTGNLSLAETEAHVYCNLIGCLAESGVMALAKSTSRGELFGRGLTNEFEVKSLDIGQVKKLLIGHKQQGRGCGWYCEKVVVCPKTKMATETIFVCDRWLDSGCNDRELMKEFSPFASLPQTDSIPHPVKTKSKGIWMCTVVTADEDKLPKSTSSSKQNKNMSIVIHGSKNVFGPKDLSDKNRKLFQPGQKDIFHGLNLSGIGDMKKIQLITDQDGQSSSEWTTQEVLLRDEETGELYHFDFSRYIGETGWTGTKEMPVINSSDKFDKVLPYQVYVHTSDKKGAGTDSEIAITIYGNKSNSGRRQLCKQKTQSYSFKPGQVDKFQLDCVDVGDLEKIVVWKGAGEPWYLEKIVIKEQEYSSQEYVFNFNRWISKDSRTREVEETEMLSSVNPSNIVAPLPPHSKQPTSRGKYKIQTVTGGGQSYAVVSDIVVIFCGEKQESSPISLDKNSNASFQPNQTSSFQVQVKEDVGELFKMRVGYQQNNQPKTWNVEKIIVEDVDSKDRFYYVFTDGVDVDDKLDGWREFPVEWPAVQPLPVEQYAIELHGDAKKPPTNNHLTCILYGEKGTTGERILKKVTSKQKEVFVYELEAVSLIELNQVKLGHHNTNKGGGFFLKKLVVKEQQNKRKEFVFQCNQWFDAGEGDKQIERILQLGQDAKSKPQFDPPSKTKPAPKTTPAPTPKPPPKKSKSEPNGDWKVQIYTSELDDAGTDSNVTLTVFGNYGNSGRLSLGEPGSGYFETGQIDEFEIWLEPSDIGKIRKIRLEHDNSGFAPGWHVEKVLMENIVTKEELVFPINKWLWYDGDHGDVVVEVPAIWPNSKVTEVHRYYVETVTGDDWGSGTDANVYMNIIGTQGNTGVRFLKNSLRGKNKFESGSTDAFEIEAVDLGKLQKVIVGHDGYGVGSGWKLEEIRLKQSKTSREVYVFQCNKWLDEGKDEKKIEVELPLTKTTTDNSPKLDF